MFFPHTDLSILSPSMRKLYDSACMELADGDFACAEALLRVLLDHVPAFENGYRALFELQVEHARPVSPLLLPVIWLMNRTRGEALLQGNSCTRLMGYVRLLFAHAPRVPSVLCFASCACDRVGFGLLATDLLELCVKHNPKDARSWRMLADRYWDLGQTHGCLAAVQQLITLLPGSPELDLELEQAMEEVDGETVEEKKVLHVLDAIEPDDSETPALEQKLRLLQGDGETLQALLSSVLKTVEEQPSVATLRTVGDLRMRLGEPNAALIDYEHAFELSEVWDPALDDCITSAEMACFEAAVEKWRVYLGANPERADVTERKIESLDIDKRKRLQERYKELIERYPTEFRYQFELGELLVSQGRHLEALPHFEAAQCARELCPSALLAAGKCLMEQGTYDLAREQLEGALRLGDMFLQGEQLEAMYALAETCEKLGGVQDALDLYKKVYAIDVTFADVGGRLQALLVRKGSTEIAARG